MSSYSIRSEGPRRDLATNIKEEIRETKQRLIKAIALVVLSFLTCWVLTHASTLRLSRIKISMHPVPFDFCVFIGCIFSLYAFFASLWLFLKSISLLSCLELMNLYPEILEPIV